MLQLFVVTLACAEQASPDFTPPRLTISLDTPPEHRWDAAVTQFNSSIHSSLASLMKNPEYAIGLKVAEDVIKHDESAVKDWYPEEQYQELKGIARVTKIDLWLLAAVTTIYDLTAAGSGTEEACTGLIVQKKDGSIIHGRNLDYSLKSGK
jgi:penicillin V acylase-like amidase (Ntn superfamily)